MKDYSIIPIREENLLPTPALVYVKGGVGMTTCGSNSCGENTGNCTTNGCVINTGNCGKNNCVKNCDPYNECVSNQCNTNLCNPYEKPGTGVDPHA